MTTSKQAILRVLLERHGQTYAHEAGIRLGRGTPAPLFQLLVLAILLSARIRAEAAVASARALFGQGWTTPDKMAAATWRDRTDVLNAAGYARYDESTSRMLGETAQMVVEQYGGDLRELRERADRDPVAERGLLEEFKGIGDVGADIFFREAQEVWHELYPFIDSRMAAAAEALTLGDADAMLRLVDGPHNLAVVGAALVRSGLAKDHEEILAQAQGE